MYCVHVFAIVYVFVCTIVVCGCICLYVYVPPMRKSGYADHCEVKSSINQSINQSITCSCISYIASSCMQRLYRICCRDVAIIYACQHTEGPLGMHS